MKTIRYIRPEIKPSRHIANSMTSSDIEEEKRKKNIARYILEIEAKKDLAERRYVDNNVCCGYVLPLNGVCDVCGKHHKIVR